MNKYRQIYRETKKRGFLGDDGIHGRYHMRRVCLFACILCESLDSSPMMTRMVLEAARLHDVGRVNDGVDDSHGPRGAEIIEKDGLCALSGIEKQIVGLAVKYHSLDDKNAIRDFFGLSRAISQYAWECLCILKDADALDRHRIDDLDPSYLRCDESKDLIGWSHEVFLRYGR